MANGDGKASQKIASAICAPHRGCAYAQCCCLHSYHRHPRPYMNANHSLKTKKITYDESNTAFYPANSALRRLPCLKCRWMHKQRNQREREAGLIAQLSNLSTQGTTLYHLGLGTCLVAAFGLAL